MLVKDLPKEDLKTLSESFKVHLKNDKADFMDCWGNLTIDYMKMTFSQEVFNGDDIQIIVRKIVDKIKKEAK